MGEMLDACGFAERKTIELASGDGFLIIARSGRHAQLK
jgi:hypothetical protein